MNHYAIRRTLTQPYAAVLERVPQALKAQGFGVLTEIDVKDTLKNKLGVDFRRYKILGACNPPFAHAALQLEIDIGVFLPCNVIVYELDDRQTVVAAVDPERTIASLGNPKLLELAKEVKQRLQIVVDSL